ncbi:entry exclusion lipoprotein TrbK [Tsukamurella asaccharolytica]|uniref:Entry exclusion lipoprotein TrbK n=1 Tax=Tsukamurella asaccharolytica TaxID=2592067 RepID=A0A5C5R921_9ACTN|nr:entry exclusion lipoprotein TrbK [Tsukamurella asaccharolytica]TWS18565.1 entry exclusion lipoprotein TrbK [Tsukamurella asaccharolytica]
MSKSTHRIRVGAAALAVVALTLTGCTKQGGDTTCEDYQKMSDTDQRDQVTKLYKDKHGDEPSALVITGLQQQAVAYCTTVGKPDSKIKEIPIS